MAKAAKPAPRKTAAKASNGGKSPEEKAPSISEGKAPGAVNLQVPPPQPGTQPSMRILGQYLKDLSFENPNAPQALAPQQSQPDINIAVNVNARNIAPTDFEVELHLDAKATSEGKVIFASELLLPGFSAWKIFRPTCFMRLFSLNARGCCFPLRGRFLPMPHAMADFRR